MTGDERFEELFRDNYADVFAYAVRRCASRQDAEDVVAETFAVAWRRLDDVPEGDRARLWLFGTARLVRLNHRRRGERRLRLVERIRQVTTFPHDEDLAGELTDSQRVRAALTELTDRDREVLQLHAWEQLAAEQIADVLGISTVAVWKRLQRARERLASLLDEDPDPDIDIATYQVRTVKEATR